MRVNRIVQAAKEGRPSYGIYIYAASPYMVETLGFAGLDYVRIDLEGSNKNIETVHHMIHTAHAVGITPLVRVPAPEGNDIDSGLIHRLVGMGAMGFIIPKGNSREYVEAAVRAVKGPPLGDRHVSASGFLGGWGKDSFQEHLEWSNENILVSVQVETKSGVEAIDEILSVPGLDMVQSGRGDLSWEYGMPGKQYDPVVMEAEKKVVDAGLKAGKLVGIQYYPLRDPSHIQNLREYIRQGVQVINIGTDSDIAEVYRRVLREIPE